MDGLRIYADRRLVFQHRHQDDGEQKEQGRDGQNGPPDTARQKSRQQCARCHADTTRVDDKERRPNPLKHVDWRKLLNRPVPHRCPTDHGHPVDAAEKRQKRRPDARYDEDEDAHDRGETGQFGCHR